MSGTYLSNHPPAGGDISRRLAGDMESVLMDASGLKKDDVFYAVYRNLEIVGEKIRYDITEIPARTVNGEFAKTFGHYHKTALPEIYEVLEGRAYFLLQKPETPENPANIKEAYIAEALNGEKIIIPPGFGHLAINVAVSELVLANWIALSDYDYGPYGKLHGGCYYVIDKGASIDFEKNKNYSHVPELKKLKLIKNLPELGLYKRDQKPILELKNAPEKLDWLIHPENYEELLTVEKLYRIL